MRTIRVVEAADWDRFAIPRSDLIFHRSLWIEALAAGLPADPIYHLLERGGLDIAGIAGVVVRLPLLATFYSGLPYGGAVGDAAAAPELFDGVAERLAATGVHRLVAVAPAGGPATPGAPMRQVVPLAGLSTADVQRRFHESVRRNVRRAERRGVIVRPATSLADVDRFHELYLASMARNGAPARYPRGLARAIWCRLTPDAAEISLAELDGRPIAGVLLVHAPTCTYYWQGGSLDAHLDARPNDLLLARAILAAASRGAADFDLLSSPPADADLLRFKAKFGARDEPLRVLERDLAPGRVQLWSALHHLATSPLGARLTRLARR